MTLAEMKKSGCGGFMRADEFKSAGIELRDNTPQEIRAAVLEMLDTPADSAQQQAFWADFPVSRSLGTDAPLHGVINLRIGRAFLASYTDGARVPRDRAA